MTTFNRTTALLVVDMQNDFADRQGSLYVTGAELALPLINAEIENASGSGAFVVYSKDWHPELTPHFAIGGGTWPAHCVAGSWGAQLHPALHVIEGAHYVLKGVNGEDGYSAFSVRDSISEEPSPTELREVLSRRGIERIVIVGLATDYCVRETALDGLRLGFDVRVLRSGVRAVNLGPNDDEEAFAAIEAAGGRLD